MKKFLSILTAITFASSITTSTIACQKEEKKQLNKQNIHEQIKTALSEPLEFNDDWIIDYDNTPEKDLKQFVSLLAYDHAWTYLTKTVSFLALQRLKTKLPNLFKVFPDFTLSTTIVSDDEEKINENLLNKQQVKFHYNFYYNLHQLQDADFNMWSNWEKGRGILKYYDHFAPGEYSLIYKDGYKNEVTFKQKKIITDDQTRINYLSMLLNATPKVRIFDENYRSFAFESSRSPNISNVYFKLSDFPNANLVETLHANTSHVLDAELKTKIKDNLKEIMKKTNETNATEVIKNMPTIFEDVDFDIELMKTYLQSDIANNEILDYIYGSHNTAFPNGILLLKIKTNLKSNDILSTKSIDEVIALNINYK